MPGYSPPTAILETALYAGDLDAAEGFYGDLLGLERVTRAGDRHVFFRCGSQILLLFNPEQTALPSTNPNLPVPTHGAHGPGHVCFAASAAELDTLRMKLLAESIEIESDFKWPNGARSIYFRDPAGNSVEFAEPRLWFD